MKVIFSRWALRCHSGWSCNTFKTGILFQGKQYSLYVIKIDSQKCIYVLFFNQALLKFPVKANLIFWIVLLTQWVLSKNLVCWCCKVLLFTPLGIELLLIKSPMFGKLSRGCDKLKPGTDRSVVCVCVSGFVVPPFCYRLFLQWARMTNMTINPQNVESQGC